MMSAISAISAASAGMMDAGSRFDLAARRTVQAAASGASGDLAGAAVDQISAKVQFEASLKTLSVSNAMYRSLLDIIV
jgi:hypothetical protein